MILENQTMPRRGIGGEIGDQVRHERGVGLQIGMIEELTVAFTLETGQEPARVLLEFFKDVDRPNLGINFDPANMILYGTGDPIEALGVLRKHVISVHAKDGDWPPTDKPGLLGTERPLGQGSVGMERFIAKLKEIGYTGSINVEREVENPQQRLTDMAAGVNLLHSLL